MQRVHQVILCTVDEKSTAAISELSRHLVQAGIVESPTGSPDPHISLISFSPFRNYTQWHFRAAFQAVSSPPSRVEFSSIGIFPGQQASIVFLGVTPTQQLLHVVYQTYRYVEAVGQEVDDLYSPDRIVLHATIGMDVPNHRLADAIQVVTQFKLPRTARIEEFALFEYPNGTKLDGFSPSVLSKLSRPSRPP